MHLILIVPFHYRNDLAKRTFKTYDFYKNLQDHMTPAGLAFFQSDYDANVKDFYHNVLNMKEPLFEYDFPQPYHPPERYFPLKQAFNLYLDRYRDPKQVRRSVFISIKLTELTSKSVNCK